MKKIDNYRIVKELGRNREGGRISYLAEDCATKQQVVIKQFRFAQNNTNWQGFKTYELSSIVAGTPGFMPPEELSNRPLSKASDLYSVGVIAIALITSIPKSQLSDLIDDNYQLQFHNLLGEINPDFVDWLDKMVASNLKNRFANAKDALGKLKPIDINRQAKVKLPEIKTKPTP